VKYLVAICLALFAGLLMADVSEAQERFRSRRAAILDQQGDLVRAQAEFLRQQNIANQQLRRQQFVRQRSHIDDSLFFRLQLQNQANLRLFDSTRNFRRFNSGFCR
jgi:hypothetical protein